MKPFDLLRIAPSRTDLVPLAATLAAAAALIAVSLWAVRVLNAARVKLLDVRDQWARSPFAFDLDNDGRDELVVWGRHALIVGSRLDAPALIPKGSRRGI